jgi:hypothetical protein
MTSTTVDTAPPASRTRRMRTKTANFPTVKTFSTWRPDQSSIPQPTQQALSRLE